MGLQWNSFQDGQRSWPSTQWSRYFWLEGIESCGFRGAKKAVLELLLLGQVSRAPSPLTYELANVRNRAISLYTGRLPAVNELPPLATLDMCKCQKILPEELICLTRVRVDDSADNELWSPYSEDHLNLTKLAPGQYPATRSNAVSCFANSCKLSIIVNDIILQVYSRRSRPITEAALKDIKARLDLWRTQSPSHLRYDPNHLPDICPPPHIMSQK